MPHALDRIATGQVSITTSATKIVDPRQTRIGIKLTKHGSQNLFVGGATVGTTTGMLFAGACGTFIIIPTTDTVYGIVASGSECVSYLEVYNA